MADASETAGAWETVTVSTPSRCSRLAHRPLSFDRERPEESSDLPDEQGIANAPVETSSEQKIATGHAESDPGKTGSSPRTATGLAETTSESDATDSGQKTVTGHAATARGRTATETSPADDALDRLTASRSGARARSPRPATGAARPSAGSTILPCSSIRRSGNTRGSRTGAEL